MAAGHMVASLMRPDSSPVLAVGATVIDLTPTPLKEYAVREFGTKDKPILVGSVMAVTLLLSMVAGVLAQRRFPTGAGLLLILVGTAGVAALTRPMAGARDIVPALSTAVVGLAVLWLMVNGPRRPGRAPEGEGTGPSRRVLLITSGLVAAASAAMGWGGQKIVAHRTRPGNVTLPDPTTSIKPLPGGLEEVYSGISSLQTPTDDFYRVDINLTLPVVPVDDWELTIDGDVENELAFSFEELADMPLIERDITMTCVSNEVGGTYVGAARWLGVPLKELLDRAGVGKDSDQILSTAVDGFTISTPLEVALDGRDSMIVIGMNGEPLTAEHGFPARMVTPGIYGFVGATKWLTKLTLTTYEKDVAYWTERDWATDAPIKIASRIDTPKPLATVKPGKVFVGGVAWAQTRGIKKVEVRIDGGAWQEARLGPDVGVDYWRQWYLPWQAESGPHMLAVRAVDLEGEVQTAVRAAPFPEGSSGVQEIAVTVE